MRTNAHLGVRVRPSVALHHRRDRRACGLRIGKALERLRHHRLASHPGHRIRGEQAADQAEWQEATTWQGKTPTAADLWRALSESGLPVVDVFSGSGGAVSKTLRAGFVQALAAEGRTDHEIIQEHRRLTGRGITAATVAGLRHLSVEPSPWKIRFANLVSGRFTELAFERAFAPRLAEVGLRLTEETQLRNFLDYRINDEDFEIAVNLKNAGVQYRDSANWVGLEPEDTLPVATYKIFGSESAGIPPLIYVYLVDWTLLARLRDAYWTKVLTSEGRAAFQLLAYIKGVPRDVEDAFIERTVGGRLEDLMASVGYGRPNLTDLPFRAISAAKCRRIFYDLHERSPYVYKQRMNTDPNVHLSVKGDTIAFSDFVEKYLEEPHKRGLLLEELAKTKQVTIPAPGV